MISSGVGIRTIALWPWNCDLLTGLLDFRCRNGTSSQPKRFTTFPEEDKSRETEHIVMQRKVSLRIDVYLKKGYPPGLAFGLKTWAQ